MTVTCPFCLGRGECCRCNSRGRMWSGDSARLLDWLWDVYGCACGTCAVLRAVRRRLYSGRHPHHAVKTS